jgi:N6-L-threonylcarbamoyladenine synthase
VPSSRLDLGHVFDRPGPKAWSLTPVARRLIMPDGIILGIESSCDETGAAVVRSGEQILSNVVASQIAAHQPYGGVVPELASREHLRAIVPVVRQALAEAGNTYQSVDAIAVTQGPGLAGALLVGISFAKALSFGLEKPLIAVNHLEGHVHAVLLEQRQAGDVELQFPVLALVVSGGHTHLYLAQAEENLWTYENIGRTRDDAAGEAFDKVAKLLGLGYPGGPIIDRLAPHGDPHAVKFQIAQIKHRDRRTRGDERLTGTENRPQFDFSYSGIKTAVLRYVETENLAPTIEKRRQGLEEVVREGRQLSVDDYLRLSDRQTLDLVASFQRVMVTDLVGKTLAAAREYDVGTLFVSGGVAANQELRTTFQREAEMQGLPVFFPSRNLSTDNAAMIAAAAFPKFLRGQCVAMDFSAEAGMALR